MSGTLRPVRALAGCLASLALACGAAPESRAPAGDDATIEPGAEERATEEHAAEIAQLEALGYIAASEPAPDASGVTLETEAAQPGLNLYVSGHAPEAMLMEMNGEPVHRWFHGFGALLDHLEQSREGVAFLDERRYWRRAHLLPDGSLLAIHTHHSLIKLDRESRLQWAYPKRAHHDLDVGPDGRIYTLVNEKKLLPRVNPSEPVLEDFVVVLDAEGHELERVSLLEAVERAGLSEILAAMPQQGDLFHANTVELLDGRLASRIPAFAAGNVLVSLLMVNAIAVLDLAAGEIVWWQQGDYRFQHDPSVLDDGRLLLFDNFGPALGERERDPRPGRYQRLWYANIFSQELPHEPASAVLEIDPLNGEVLWQYRGSAQRFFSSETCGAVQRLANGNTLIVETQFGRAFEVTRAGDKVWEFVSPHRLGANVAQLFDLERIDPNALAWLPERSSR